ncbi:MULTISPECIES: ABC transporter substrate-binding protein [Agrobacterium]|uniref:ABC transporter substrate-binding protein n=1 Tax=Agrobacterium tumefaciens TaxID=358 RepID=A0AA44F433_AGRTU|nr:MULTISPECIES: ABC transporter substrate-binding protein [Agrobacterium]NSL20799.1 ABC transporter substrate-binding protein [Agrobacterium tumefaciens]NSY60471.1 ABC transporter substrate-binding protein [Agrobacterium tumefaciens]NTA12112.1 ABC transporter substrate-binding protein [Agrobacterium tumefaciens]NTA60423.1 ABC transporter substrate-binding protein [Agrobacterium tumefaciens]NTB85262.1 ABC transporter substrate-binding protein [Agrobacterium tumefaciens]
MAFSSKLLSFLAGGLFTATTALISAAHAQEIDLSPEQKGRVRAEKVEEAIKLLPAGHKFVADGKLTVATVPFRLPLVDYASDTKTPIGVEPDIAQLVADSLGLELQLVPIAWADWPLGLTSGKYDAVTSNITVTEARKEKFDFSSYRNDLLGFYVGSNSKVTSISKPEDVAGLKVIVGAATNQEQILLKWIKDNKAKGLADTDVQYYDDQAVLDVALQSGRADAYLGPNATSAFQAASQKKTKLVGTFSGGWPEAAEIAVASKKDAGIAAAITAALNAQIKNGNYGKVLARWNLGSEAITESRTNPPGLPKS